MKLADEYVRLARTVDGSPLRWLARECAYKDGEINELRKQVDQLERDYAAAHNACNDVDKHNGNLVRLLKALVADEDSLPGWATYSLGAFGATLSCGYCEAPIVQHEHGIECEHADDCPVKAARELLGDAPADIAALPERIDADQREIAALRNVLAALLKPGNGVTDAPVYRGYIDLGDFYVCWYCGDRWVNRTGPEHHADDCPVRMAQELLGDE